MKTQDQNVTLVVRLLNGSVFTFVEKAAIALPTLLMDRDQFETLDEYIDTHNNYVNLRSTGYDVSDAINTFVTTMISDIPNISVNFAPEIFHLTKDNRVLEAPVVRLVTEEDAETGESTTKTVVDGIATLLLPVCGAEVLNKCSTKFTAPLYTLLNTLESINKPIDGKYSIGYNPLTDVSKKDLTDLIDNHHIMVSEGIPINAEAMLYQIKIYEEQLLEYRVRKISPFGTIDIVNRCGEAAYENADHPCDICRVVNCDKTIAKSKEIRAELKDRGMAIHKKITEAGHRENLGRIARYFDIDNNLEKDTDKENPFSSNSEMMLFFNKILASAARKKLDEKLNAETTDKEKTLDIVLDKLNEELKNPDANPEKIMDLTSKLEKLKRDAESSADLSKNRGDSGSEEKA